MNIIDHPGKKGKATKRGTGEWARRIGNSKFGKSQSNESNSKRKEAAELRTLKVGLYDLLREAFISSKKPKVPKNNDKTQIEGHIGSLLYDYLIRKLEEDEK